MEMEEHLEIIKDTRKLLIDRLDSALYLIERDDIIFPARTQYLLDWLLDSFVRLQKASQDKIVSVIKSSKFWLLLIGLFKDLTQRTKESRKRKLLISKPVLPAFTTYLKFQPGGDDKTKVYDLVIEGMRMVMENDDIILRTSSKVISDLVSEAVTRTIDDEMTALVGRILIQWASYQIHKKKLFSDIGTLTLSLVKILSSTKELQETLLKEIIFSSEIIEELSNELENPQNRQHILETLDSSNVPKSIILKAFYESAKSTLSKESLRLALVRLFKEFFHQGIDHKNLLIDEIANCKISAIQNDKAWELLCETLKKDLINYMSNPVILKSILTLDPVFINPILDEIWSYLLMDSDWHQFFNSLSHSYFSTRQIDTLIFSSSRSSTTVTILGSWLRELKPSLKQIHNNLIKEIVKTLININLESTFNYNSIRWLEAITIAKPEVITFYVDDILKFPSSEERSALLELVIDRCDTVDLRKFENEIAPSTILALSLKRKEYSKVNVSTIPPDCVEKYLPQLPSFPVSYLTHLPLWMFKSALFWEKVPNLSVLFRSNVTQHDRLLYLFENLPSGVQLDFETINMCIKELLNCGKLLQYPKIILKILQQKSCRELGPDLSKNIIRIWPLNSLITIVDALAKLSILDRKDLWDYVKGDIGLIAQVFSQIDWKSADFTESLSKFTLGDALLNESLYCLLPLKYPNLQDMSLLLGEAQKIHNLRGLNYYRCMTLLRLVGFNFPPEFNISVLLEQDYLDLSLIRRLFSTLSKEELFSIDFARFDELNVRIIWAFDTLLLREKDENGFNFADYSCPIIDGSLGLLNCCERSIPEETSQYILKLLLHRALSGSDNIKTFQEDLIFNKCMLIFSKLKFDFESFVTFTSCLVQNHWIPLMRCKPLLIAVLLRLLRVVPLESSQMQRRFARLLGDMGRKRQADLNYYLSPLILEFCHLNMSAECRSTLTPSFCILIRHIDLAISAEAMKNSGKTEKYFNGNQFDRLIKMTETDDAKVLLKNLIKTYNEEYKYTGKA